jgi:hypothetical protein
MPWLGAAFDLYQFTCAQRDLVIFENTASDFGALHISDD